MLLTSVGLAIGFGGSLLLTPVLQSFLIDLPASDSITFGAVAVALVAIALVASYVARPARDQDRSDCHPAHGVDCGQTARSIARISFACSKCAGSFETSAERSRRALLRGVDGSSARCGLG